MGTALNALTGAIVDAGLKVHRALGPGLLESSYQRCLAFELGQRGVRCRAEVDLPIAYEGFTLPAGYRLDLLVEESVIVEVKAVEALSRLHEAQIMTYLKLSGHKVGLLMNFNVELFKNGLRRFVV